MPGATSSFAAKWTIPFTVFTVVLLAQLWLVAAAGTDIPFYDQWGSEGRWLYPAWSEGNLKIMDLFRPHNEHRIFWTHLLNLALFTANGAWDPLVQIFCGAILHALAAAVSARMLTDAAGLGRKLFVGALVALACLPIGGWHNALWGFQSQVYFSLLFGLPALAWLPCPGTRWQGALCALAAMVAMGSGALVPVALLGSLALRMTESRLQVPGWKTELVLLLALSALGLSGQLATTGDPSIVMATSVRDFAGACVSLLAWPHPEQPFAALILNLPLAVAIVGRLANRRRAAPGENLVVVMAIWIGVIIAAAAWTRGGGPELVAGVVPSRYVDFIVLLPLANAWCVVQLVREEMGRRPTVFVVGMVWGLFLMVGWLGVSTQMWRGIIQPRIRDRAAPERLMREFQLSHDPVIFAGQPRLLVPHPDLEPVQLVLTDPRMKGVLPPSLQPERPMGPLSRAVRKLLGR